MKEFGTAFNQADLLFLTEVYPAGEEAIPGISGEALFNEVNQFGHKNVYYEPDMNKIAERIAEIALPQDMILVLGAGSINKTIPDIIKRLKEKKNGS